MLDIHFLNVGDGDAVLLESGSFRMLVDAGRARLKRTQNSCAKRAAQHLQQREIDHLDLLVVTHLHKDHFGGVQEVLQTASVDRVCAGFFPAQAGERAPSEPDAPKTVRGLLECLNLWAETAEAMRTAGCILEPVTATRRGLQLAEGLTCDLLCPSEQDALRQRRAWQAMLSGRLLADGEAYWASKSRNPNSLRLRLTYAGRSLELTGDCYGEVWAGEALSPCDILKVPHHGDKKALTRELMEKLRPKWAVISCGAAYNEKKDRPSSASLALLEEQGTPYWFTDAFAAPGRRADRWSSVDFRITDDGRVIAPGQPQRRREVVV